MTTISGMLNLEQLTEQVGAEEIETVIVGFTDLYGRLLGKRFDASFFLDAVAHDGTHACDYLLTVDMEMNPVAGYQAASWEKGYGDFHLHPDLKTLRRASWLDRTAIVFCNICDPTGHDPVPHAPRSMLLKQIERAEGLGYTVMAASEIEYYIFRDSYKDSMKKGYADIEPAGWYIEDYHTMQGSRVEDINAAARWHLNRSGVPVECTKGEWGLGQHELNVRYSDVLEMADRHSIYKQCVREIADQMEISVTFMAKYAAESAGSSCHVHISLWKDGEGVFAGDHPLGPTKCSDEFRWFLGGWIAHSAEVMVFYAPNVNSYKRYQSGSWAPTKLAWSHDNRTAGFRIVGQGDSLRIECRIPGADCNPYLTYAGALAAGLDGIANKIEPPPIFEGDLYSAKELPEVPRTLHQAIDLFENSEFTRQAFGEEVVDHYTHFFRSEQQSYDRAVTDWERKRYFERI